ncbi:MAG: hypothetical protein ACI8W7_002397 [Gammaproteobacteria bacterium]|jgi:hypothetical protein
MDRLLTADEIKQWQPYSLSHDGVSTLRHARMRMLRSGQWAPWQMLGRRMAIGCVALEITQRCNLDCSYCYLSESSEALKDIPIAVVFNTTICRENFHEIPELVKFFVRHCDVVRLTSFQIGADTGRGTVRERVAVNPETVVDAIQSGAQAKLNFGAASAGHSACNRYAYGLVINRRVHDFFNDPCFVQEILQQSSALVINRANKPRACGAVAGFAVRHPRLLAGALWRFAKLAVRERRDLIAARGRVGKLSFFVHNFMDAEQLERVRCDACSFMVMTAQGPMSMCVHNAKRDDYLVVATAVKRENVVKFFNPLTGNYHNEVPESMSVTLTRKNARGRARAKISARMMTVTKALERDDLR